MTTPTLIAIAAGLLLLGLIIIRYVRRVVAGLTVPDGNEDHL